MSLNLFPILDSETTEDFMSRLTDGQKSRLKEALTGDYKAYPSAKGSYRVYSYDSTQGDSSQTYYTMHTQANDPVCGCRDFFYRGQTESTSFHRCKHLWRVWAEVYIGLLPPETEHPYMWLDQTVENELFAIIAELEAADGEPNDLKQKASQLRALSKYIENNKRHSIDFKKAYSSWARYNDVYRVKKN